MNVDCTGGTAKYSFLRLHGNIHADTYLTIFASFDLSNKWAASTADTIAPSSADRSQYSSVTRNLLAKLKNAAGFLDALTAMTWRSWGMQEETSCPVMEVLLMLVESTPETLLVWEIVLVGVGDSIVSVPTLCSAGNLASVDCFTFSASPAPAVDMLGC
jgi:hypothetical protein